MIEVPRCGECFACGSSSNATSGLYECSFSCWLKHEPPLIALFDPLQTIFNSSLGLMGNLGYPLKVYDIYSLSPKKRGLSHLETLRDSFLQTPDCTVRMPCMTWPRTVAGLRKFFV